MVTKIVVITLAKIRRYLRRFFARHRFLLRVETVLFWLLCAVGVYFLTGLFVVPLVAEAKLRQFCGGAVDIQSGGFKGFGGVRLKGLMVADDSQKLIDAPILQADRVDMRFEPWQLLKGNFKIHSILVKDVLLTADYDSARKKWNLGDLFFEKSGLPERTPLALITIERGALRLRRVGPEGPEVVTMVSIHGSIGEQPGKNEYAFMFETDGRFGYGKSSLAGGLRMGQNGSQNQLWATGQIQMPASGVLSNRWDLQDIKLDCVYDEESIDVRQLSCRMGDGRMAFHGRMHWKDDRPFDLNIDLENLTLSDQFISDTIVYARLHEFFDSGLTHFLDEYHPAGQGDMKLAVKGSVNELSKATLDGVIRCKDISIYKDEFPYRLEKMQGDIIFEGRDITLNALQTQHGDVRLEINGTVKNLGSNTSIDIQATSANMRFDEDLKKALSESVQKVWFEFSPTGRTGVDYHFERSPDGQKDVTVDLNLDQAGAVYKYFPYPLENLTGTIKVKSGQIKLEKVQAHYNDGRRVQVDGQIFRLDSPEPAFHITIQGDNIPVDERLIKSMPEKQQRLFDRLQTQAVADLKVDVFPKGTDPRYLDYTAQILINAETFSHERFPLPMTDAVLEAMVTQDVVKVEHFEARTPCGPIKIGKSDVWPQGADPNRPGFCLKLDLKKFELNDFFWNVAGADANELLGALRAFGAVDVNGLFVVNSLSPEFPSNDLMIDCTANPLQWAGVDAGTASGRVWLKNDLLSFSDFNLKDIPLESLPPDRMPPRTRELYSGVRPKGSAEVMIHQGTLEAGQEGLERMDVDAEINLKNVSFEKAAVIHELNGTCKGRFASDLQKGIWQTRAQYNISQLRYAQWLVENLKGTLTYDPNSAQLKSNDLKANFYCADSPCRNDQVTGKLIINLGPQAQANYELELNYQSVDIQSLIAATRQVTQEQSMKGQAAGNLVLVGQLNDLSQPRGKFRATILDMQMGQQSLLGKVLTAVQLRRPENFVFSEMELAADVRDSELIFDRVRMVGNPLVFHGKGTVNLKSRQISMELASWDRVLRGEDTVLDALMRGIGSALWKVEIHGDLDSPQVDAVFLSVLKQPLDVFRKKTEGVPAEEGG